jgi:hypothetical protein
MAGFSQAEFLCSAGRSLAFTRCVCWCFAVCLDWSLYSVKNVCLVVGVFGD